MLKSPRFKPPVPYCPDYSACPSDCVQDPDYCCDCGIPDGHPGFSLYKKPKEVEREQIPSS